MENIAISTERIEVQGRMKERYSEILSPEALAFVAALHRKFRDTRHTLLQGREQLQHQIEEGTALGFPEETLPVRDSQWRVGPIPDDLQDRRTEITGPVDRKMIVNALNSGASVFMADFEDATAPTWENVLDGQVNLYDAIRRQVDFTAPNGKTYALKDKTAVLKVRPRGWHLDEKHVLVDGEPVSASLFDFGLYFFHNAEALLARGSGPYFYLPKLEHYLEARLWNSVFIEAQDKLGLRKGIIKTTVLIETITAALQMDEILYELRNHIAGLNAGRWDYIFSVIKRFRNSPDAVLPDRQLVGMRAPFMAAYANKLVKVCHSRGAHAIGGMSAFIPSKDEAINQKAYEQVRADKELEALRGFDGTWVAHPGLIPVAKGVFDNALGSRRHQKDFTPKDDQITAEQLLDFKIEGGEITVKGLMTNIEVAIEYMAEWLNGRGAVGINNLMEDAATAEISRAQLWQWIQHKATLQDGTVITEALCKQYITAAIDKLKARVGEQAFKNGHYHQAAKLLEGLVFTDQFANFLTLGAYQQL